MSDFFDELERELRRATVRRAAAQRAARVALLRRIPLAAAVAVAVLLAFGATGAVVALDPGPGAALDPAGARTERSLTLPAQTAPWPPTVPGPSEHPSRLPAQTTPAATGVVPQPADREGAEPGWSGPAGGVRFDGSLLSNGAVEPELRALLGVLRDPPRPPGRSMDDVRGAGQVLPRSKPFGERAPEQTRGPVLLHSVRRAAQGEWGSLSLVPFRPAKVGAGPRADRIVVTLRVDPPGREDAGVQQQVVSPPAAGIADAGVLTAASAGGRAVTAMLVPDGVARVAMTFDGRRSHALVVDNVAVVQRRAHDARPREITWYDAQGRAITQVRPRP